MIAPIEVIEWVVRNANPTSASVSQVPHGAPLRTWSDSTEHDTVLHATVVIRVSGPSRVELTPHQPLN